MDYRAGSSACDNFDGLDLKFASIEWLLHYFFLNRNATSERISSPFCVVSSLVKKDLFAYVSCFLADVQISTLS